MSEQIGTSAAALLRASHTWTNAVQRALVSAVDETPPVDGRALVRLLHKALSTDVRSELARLRAAAGHVAIELASPPVVVRELLDEYSAVRGPADVEYVAAYAVTDHDLGRLYPVGVVYARRTGQSKDVGRLIRRGVEVFGLALVAAVEVVRTHPVAPRK